jgi:hypothetical protein
MSERPPEVKETLMIGSLQVFEVEGRPPSAEDLERWRRRRTVPADDVPLGNLGSGGVVSDATEGPAEDIPPSGR